MTSNFSELAADQIRAKGFCKVQSLTRQQRNDINDFLMSRQIYPGCHVTHSAGAPGPWDDHLSADVISWHMHDVLRCPHLLEHALQYTDVAAKFLKVDIPVFYSVNAFCTRPVPHVRPDIQDWHRDADDVAFVPMFIYLTDVGEQEAQRLRGPFGEQKITGPAGTAFFSNTMEEHLGGKPVDAPRVIFWARWGVSNDPPPAAYQWDKLTPIDKNELGDRYPTDLRLQDSMRLLAR